MKTPLSLFVNIISCVSVNINSLIVNKTLCGFLFVYELQYEKTKRRRYDL